MQRAIRALIAAGTALLCACASAPVAEPTPLDPRSGRYLVAGEHIALADGISVVETPAGQRITRYFGNPVSIDLDGDGRDDTVFMLTQQIPPGPVRFFVAAALDRPEGLVGTEAMLIGEEIAPQPMHIDAGRVVVNFAERAPGDPTSTRASHGRSVWLHFDAARLQFGELVRDFPGEADPERMKLGMKRWDAVRIVREDLTMRPIGEAERIALELREDGSFSAYTPCATLAGKTKRVSGQGEGAIEFFDIATTPHPCAVPSTIDYAAYLEAVNAYTFTGRGELVLSSARTNTQVHFR